MNSATEERKLLICPHCKTEQRVHLRVLPDKPRVLILACARGFLCREADVCSRNSTGTFVPEELVLVVDCARRPSIRR
jgi:hypothetical protein